MAIESVGGAPPTFTAWRAERRKRFESDFKDLAQALASGDVGAAQKAFATLKKNAPPRPKEREDDGDADDRRSAPTADPAATGAGAAPRPNPFDGIGEALAKGDIGLAQEAFAALQSRFQAPNRTPETRAPEPTNLDQFAAQIGTGKVSAYSVDVYA